MSRDFLRKSFFETVIFPYQDNGCLGVRKLRVFNISSPQKTNSVESNTSHEYRIKRSSRTWIIYRKITLNASKPNGMIANLLMPGILSTQCKLLFRVNIFKFPHLTAWLFSKRRQFLIFGQFWGYFNETNGKNLGFYVEKRREKTRISKRAQKSLTKKKELIFNFKIFKYE